MHPRVDYANPDQEYVLPPLVIDVSYSFLLPRRVAFCVYGSCHMYEPKEALEHIGCFHETPITSI